MASKPFRFKRFQVDDGASTHKVGTDGVLLGSWVSVLETDRQLLDIGTGSGLIALMLAQRRHADAHIDAIEIEEADAIQARENVARSPWPQKITVQHIALQNFSTARRYDLIVSNPPFFISSLLPPEKKRSQARHTHGLAFKDLFASAMRLLQPSGRFAVVLPYGEGENIVRLSTDVGLHLTRMTTFRTRPHKPIERLLAEFSRIETPLEKSELTLYADGDNWREEYKKLTRDFYLKSGV